MELIFIFKIYPYVFKSLSINFGNYLYKTFQTSDVFETSDVWEICRGDGPAAPTKRRVKGRTGRNTGRNNYLPPTRYYNPKTDFVSQTEFILVRHRMSARHPMSGILLYDEMRLEQTALALQKDIGCFRKHPMSGKLL